MLTLMPMSTSELESWLPQNLDNYLDEVVASGEEISAAKQNLKANKDALFPEGTPAKGQHFLNILDQDVAVGTIWLREPQIESSGAWYIYNIEIEKRFRGKGYGRRTMEEAENWVRTRGGTRLALNVFGHNVVARSLYDSLGFRTQATRMFKDL